MVAEVASYAALAGGLGLLTALVASAHGWPVPARVAAGLVLAIAGMAVPYTMTVLYLGLGVELSDSLRRLRVDNPASSPVYRPSGAAALAGVQGFGVALGAGWWPGWVGWAASCVAVLVWGLAGVGVIPLPGRARRMSRGSWVRGLRVRYRRRSRQLVVSAVVWWPSHLAYRAIVRVTGGDCETGDGPSWPLGQPPRAERVSQLVKTRPIPRWVHQRLHERIDLGAFPACRSLTVVVTTDPPPGREGRARVQLEHGPQAQAGPG